MADGQNSKFVIYIVNIHELQNTMNKTTTCTRKAKTDKRNPANEISLSMSGDKKGNL
jgi:hypothetical protein